jgi:hypothetical protein
MGGIEYAYSVGFYREESARKRPDGIDDTASTKWRSTQDSWDS